MKLTPLKIELLLHIYALAEPFDHPNGPAWEEAKHEFLQNVLAVYTPETECGMRLTRKGRMFIKMILATPLPLESYVDPRTGKELE